MKIDIIKSIVLNIGMLVMIALILARTNRVKKSILRERPKKKDQILMILIFSGISILSTYTGVEVRGAIANTRVIGVMAGGFLGGPMVGIGTGMISGIHRYMIDRSGFSAVACALSTFTEGMIASFSYTYVKRTKYKETDLFLLTFLAEIIQMIIILLVAKPYSEALALVQEIAIPMVLFNSFGMVLFVSIFKHILVEQEYEIGKKVQLTFEITKKCLPILNTGQYNEENCKLIGEIVQKATKGCAILFTNTERVLAYVGKVSMPKGRDLELPDLVKCTMSAGNVCTADGAEPEDVLYKVLDKQAAIAAPLHMNGSVFGCFVIFVPKFKISMHAEEAFAEGLSKLFSVQMELSQMEKQRELRQKAEYHALQSQINPHFIFNSLNTISAFCREKPEKARELLIDLATYFRNSIQKQDGFISIYEEIDFVKAYLQLEKARFDERLEIRLEIPDGLKCKVPCLILQPIVENAIIHGAMKRKTGQVFIQVAEVENRLLISVKDNGYGIPQEIIHRVKNGCPEGQSIGLYNVEKRLRYIYGENRGLSIRTSEEGTEINMEIPYESVRA